MTNSFNGKLYRHFDKDENLLYVGISLHLMDRIKCHKTDSHWFDEVVTIKIQKYKTKESLIKAEKKAINIEHPKYNIQFLRFKNIKPSYLFNFEELSIYMRIDKEILKKEVYSGNFPFEPETKKPYRWMKWKIDIHSYKTEIKEYLKRIQK